MWSKAPAVKEKPQQPAKSKAQSAPAVDADAALRSAQQARSCGQILLWLSLHVSNMPILAACQQLTLPCDVHNRSDHVT